MISNSHHNVFMYLLRDLKSLNVHGKTFYFKRSPSTLSNHCVVLLHADCLIPAGVTLKGFPGCLSWVVTYTEDIAQTEIKNCALHWTEMKIIAFILLNIKEYTLKNIWVADKKKKKIIKVGTIKASCSVFQVYIFEEQNKWSKSLLAYNAFLHCICSCIYSNMHGFFLRHFYGVFFFFFCITFFI